MKRGLLRFLVYNRRLGGAIHRAVHRDPTRACWICANFWRTEIEPILPAVPEGHKHFYRWSDIVAEKQGGPTPRCRQCGEAAR